MLVFLSPTFENDMDVSEIGSKDVMLRNRANANPCLKFR
jgi:hypothetical protein